MHNQSFFLQFDFRHSQRILKTHFGLNQPFLLKSTVETLIARVKGCGMYGTFQPMTVKMFRSSRKLTRARGQREKDIRKTFKSTIFYGILKSRPFLFSYEAAEKRAQISNPVKNCVLRCVSNVFFTLILVHIFCCEKIRPRKDAE